VEELRKLRRKVRRLTDLLSEVEAGVEDIFQQKLKTREKSEDKGVTLVAVVAVILDHEGRVLLTRRNIPPYYGRWVMPGGRISHREHINKALKREVMEEVGLDIEIEELIEVFEAFPKRGPTSHYIILFYQARPLGKKITINPREVVEARWVTADDYASYDTPKGTSHVLRKIFSRDAKLETVKTGLYDKDSR
jgi:8-oxo-dGTP diphosphatase